MRGSFEWMCDSFRDAPSRKFVLHCLAVVCLMLSGRCGLVVAADTGSPPVELGWQGTCVVGRWADVTLEFDAPQAGEYDVCVGAPDPDGHRVTFVQRTRLVAGRQVLHGYFKAGQQDAEIDVAVTEAGSDRALASWKRTAQWINPDAQLILTVGSPPGFDVESQKSLSTPGRFHPIDVTVDKLPTQPRSYDSVSLMVVAGNSIVTAEQAVALRDWVTSGGRLLIALPRELSAARQVLDPFSNWLPITVAAEPIRVSEFGRLEFYAGKNVRIPLAGRLPIPALKFEQADVLAGSREEALLVRAPFGLGSVTVLALDLTQPPLSAWTGLPSLIRRLAETSSDSGSAATNTRNQQLSSTGITDLATQLHSVQEDFQVFRASPWLVLGLLLIFLLIIGPLDYFVVTRLLKWPRGTWITLPVWVVLGSILATSLAARWNGGVDRINQLNLVNFDVGTSTFHQRLWTNVYSHAMLRRSVDVQSTIGGPSAARQTGWSGIPESVYGGMLRTASVQVGAADYRLESGTTLRDLPLLQWSSKPLQTEIHSHTEGLVESDLTSNGVGQLSGSILHRFPGPIEDWLLAYGNRVYRHKRTREDAQSLPFPPVHVLRLEQPNIFPRELRAYLTGQVSSGRQTGSNDTSNQFTPYDTLSLEPDEILRILTFHDIVGGAKYTGLTNRLLEHEDLSHLLKLGRAILFGRLSSPITSVQIDGDRVTPNRETTFLRIVLPVKSVGSDVHRPLERFE